MKRGVYSDVPAGKQVDLPGPLPIDGYFHGQMEGSLTPPVACRKKRHRTSCYGAIQAALVWTDRSAILPDIALNMGSQEQCHPLHGASLLRSRCASPM